MRFPGLWWLLMLVCVDNVCADEIIPRESLDTSDVLLTEKLEDCTKFGRNLLNPTQLQIDNACQERRSNKKEDGFVYVSDPGRNGYICCIDKTKVCGGADEPLIEDGKLKTCSHFSECGTSGMCFKSTNGIHPKELERFRDDQGRELVIGDICCHVQAEKNDNCEVGNAISHIGITSDKCQNGNGRCEKDGKYGVCSRTEVTSVHEASCCELKSEHLCPGGLLPISLRILPSDEKFKYVMNAYDFRFSKATSATVETEMKKKCENKEFKGERAAYVHTHPGLGDVCCPYTAVSIDLSTIKIVKSRSTKCTTNDNCKSKEMCLEVIDPFSHMKGSEKLCFDAAEDSSNGGSTTTAPPKNSMSNIGKLCPTDNFTKMDQLPKCEESVCNDVDMKTKHIACQKDSKEVNKCCPLPAINGKLNPNVIKNKIKSFKLSGMKCNTAKDCGGNGKYCRDEVCWNYGHNSVFRMKEKCKDNTQCKRDGKITYHCIKMGSADEDGVCAHHTKIVYGDGRREGYGDEDERRSSSSRIPTAHFILAVMYVFLK